MTRLLVSVRDLAEARLAASAGVAIIDFKEPAAGPLAATDSSVWRAAAAELSHQALSAALGESTTAIDIATRVPPQFTFAKAGPSGQTSASQLRRFWDSIALPDGVELVAVAYADADAARCVDADDVLSAAIADGRKRFLVDTFAKDGRGLIDHLSIDGVGALTNRALDAGVDIMLAGSITLELALQLHHAGVHPTGFGVRGDVCQPGLHASVRRVSGIDPDRIRRWMQSVDRWPVRPG